ncbi:hypothetical protein C0J52_06297 [Blattella germanica]|nr:hypothetical protein C0J52_06297 [Blattella germanica]
MNSLAGSPLAAPAQLSLMMALTSVLQHEIGLNSTTMAKVQLDFSTLRNRLNTCETARKSLQNEYDNEQRACSDSLQNERNKLRITLDNMLLNTSSKLAKKDDEILELSSQIEINNATITQLQAETVFVDKLEACQEEVNLTNDAFTKKENELISKTNELKIKTHELISTNNDLKYAKIEVRNLSQKVQTCNIDVQKVQRDVQNCQTQAKNCTTQQQTSNVSIRCDFIYEFVAILLFIACHLLLSLGLR